MQIRIQNFRSAATFENKKVLIVAVTCFVWIFTKLISYNLWHSNRLFPLVPPIEFLENVPNVIHLALFWLALLGMGLIAFFQNNRYLIFATLFIEFCSLMLDQNRWQPYEYQFFITILFLLCFQNNPKQFLNYFAFLLIVVYVNSGLHKVSGAFLHGVWEQMILRQFFGFDPVLFQKPLIHYAGLLAAFVEFGSGLGLLFLKRKKIYAAVLIAMHLFILLILSPLGINHNSVVWPWNAVMIFYLYVVFVNSQPVSINWKPLFLGFNKIHFIYLGVFPLFCFIGWYDNFLSFNVYSGSVKTLEICIQNPEEAQEYKAFFDEGSRYCKTGSVIKINNWSLREMNIIAYPEKRNYSAIIKSFKKRNPKVKATYYIYEYPYKPENCKTFK